MTIINYIIEESSNNNKDMTQNEYVKSNGSKDGKNINLIMIYGR